MRLKKILRRFFVSLFFLSIIAFFLDWANLLRVGDIKFLHIGIASLVFLLFLAGLLKIKSFFQAVKRINLSSFFEKEKIVLGEFFSKNWVKWGLIPLCLLAFGFTFIFYNIMTAKDPFTVLSYEISSHCKTNLRKVSYEELEEDPESSLFFQLANSQPYFRQNQEQKLQHQAIIRCFFNARLNNLGSIALKFNKLDENSLDQKLAFGIKECSSEDWYYVNKYNINLIREGEYFPFGFPIVEPSEGKQYEVRVEILGIEEESIDFVKTIKVRHKYDKKALLGSREMLKEVFWEKVRTFNGRRILFNVLVFFSPFFFYFVLICRKRVRTGRQDVIKKLSLGLLFFLALLTIQSYFSFKSSSLVTSILEFYVFTSLICCCIVKKGKLDETTKEKRNSDFSAKFSHLSKIFLLKRLAEWAHREGWWYFLGLLFCCLLFLGFSTHHLGQFMSVDEPKWINNRVPQLYEAISSFEPTGTYINDKPGILPSLLAGLTNLFLDHKTYRADPLNYETYLFFWRLPIVIFNLCMLFLIYYFLEKLLSKHHALLTIMLIALNPIIIGVSQIVNPDATLWSVSFLSFITFFLYIKTNYKKYIYYSGFFLGLALLSKFSAAILYPIFILTIYFEYLIYKRTVEHFFTRLSHMLQLFAASIAVYTLFFPATWTNPRQIIRGTIGAGVLSAGMPYFTLFTFLAAIDLLLLKGRITKFLREKFNIASFAINTLSLILFVIFTLLMFNLVAEKYFPNFNCYKNLQNILKKEPDINRFFISVKKTLLSSPPPLILGFFLFWFTIFIKSKSIYNKNKLLILSTIVFALSFLIGGTMGGYVIVPRYQIMLYPLFAMTTTIFIYTFFKNKIIPPIVILSSLIFIVVNTAPFYLHYSNLLNLNNYVVTDAWGYGGYELAQKMNKLPNAQDLSVWVDREGFSNFFVGKSYWRGRYNPFDYNPDYLILTERGKAIFTRALERYNDGYRYLYAIVAGAGENSILEYYQREPLYKVCINGNPNNCVWVVKFSNSGKK